MLILPHTQLSMLISLRQSMQSQHCHLFLWLLLVYLQQCQHNLLRWKRKTHRQIMDSSQLQKNISHRHIRVQTWKKKCANMLPATPKNILLPKNNFLLYLILHNGIPRWTLSSRNSTFSKITKFIHFIIKSLFRIIIKWVSPQHNQMLQPTSSLSIASPNKSPASVQICPPTPTIFGPRRKD